MLIPPLPLNSTKDDIQPSRASLRLFLNSMTQILYVSLIYIIQTSTTRAFVIFERFQAVNEPPDLVVPSLKEQKIIQNAIRNNTELQSAKLIQATKHCLPGKWPLLFPPKGKQIPMLNLIGAVGQTAYKTLKSMVKEGSVRLPRSLSVKFQGQVLAIDPSLLMPTNTKCSKVYVSSQERLV